MPDGRYNLTPVFAGAAVGICIALLLAWQQAADASSTARFFFSSPIEIGRALWDGIVSGVSVSDLAASGTATLVGLALGIVAGCGVGVAALAIPPAKPVIQGTVAVLAAFPILAVAPMFLLWFGTGLMLKVALAVILASLVIAARTISSDRAVSRELLAFLHGNQIPPRVRSIKIIFPMSLDWTLQAIPAAANAAFLGVFIGEFVAADKGIGYRILRAGALYQVDVVLAQTVLALAMLLIIQTGVILLRRQIKMLARFISLDPMYRRCPASI